MHRIGNSRSTSPGDTNSGGVNSGGVKSGGTASTEATPQGGPLGDHSIPPEICERCFSDLVQPVDAQTEQSGSVLMTLRCPECHHVRTGQCSWEEARQFGRHFAKGRAALRTSYNELVDENFRDELDCLVLALHTGLIGPDDFAPFRYSD